MMLLILLSIFTLSWNSAPMDSFTLQLADTLDYRIWDRPPVCTVERPCDSLEYTPMVGVVEQVRVVAHKAGIAYPAIDVWTLLALDWSQGNDTPTTYYGSGGMGCTQVQVLLPSPRWTVPYSYDRAVPVYVRATCDFDYNGDGRVNLSDLVTFAAWWIANGRPLNELASFGADYGSVKREWRE